MRHGHLATLLTLSLALALHTACDEDQKKTTSGCGGDGDCADGVCFDAACFQTCEHQTDCEGGKVCADVRGQDGRQALLCVLAEEYLTCAEDGDCDTIVRGSCDTTSCAPESGVCQLTTAADGASCTLENGGGGVCEAGTCVAAGCQPDCEGKNCGDDGCDGSCGDCAGAQEACQNGACVCVSDCTGRDCGDDGCGGSCGTCEGLDTCEAGLCMPCALDCDGKVCGDDGCGGSCGDCEGLDTCEAGQCMPCALDCAGKNCGGDGCGGSCGDCATGSLCQASGICLDCGCVDPYPACVSVDGQAICVQCGRDEDCASGSCDLETYACVSTTPVPGDKTTGESCTEDAECASGMCSLASQGCALACESAGDCAGPEGKWSGQCGGFWTDITSGGEMVDVCIFQCVSGVDFSVVDCPGDMVCDQMWACTSPP